MWLLNEIQAVLRAGFLVLRPKTMKIFKNKNTQKREEKGLKNEGASMRLALYKGYFMSNLARIGLNYTVSFV